MDGGRWGNFYFHWKSDRVMKKNYSKTGINWAFRENPDHQNVIITIILIIDIIFDYSLDDHDDHSDYDCGYDYVGSCL